jgi:hypothetical protein
VLSVLSAADWDFWRREGYLIVRNAATPVDVELVKTEIQGHIGCDLADRNSW